MKIAFATDLHIGATPADYHQQTYWQGGHLPVVQALRAFIEKNKIDLLLLGGDMTHATLPAEVARFIELFRDFPVGIMLCLGNHDVCISPDTDHFELWLDALDPHENFILAPAAAIARDVDLFSLNTHWIDAAGKPALWYQLNSGPVAGLRDEDLDQLDQWLARSTDKPAIVMVHGELDSLPASLTGLDRESHIPAAAYARTLNDLLNRHPRCKLVLSGHNHVTHAVWHGPRVHLTTGSMTEFPFSIRLIEVTPAAINITTPALLPAPAHIQLDESRRWSLGREQDRTLMILL